MKKLFIGVMLFTASLVSRASVHVVDVINFQFNPSNLTVAVGDVVRFSFSEGTHNAKSTSDIIPAGAPLINSGAASSLVRTYDYTVAVAGDYTYYCSVHGTPTSGMRGFFTATGTLPLTFIDFQVRTGALQQPMVSWKTSSEQNVAKFTVLSSTDGKRFNQVGEVKAAGNSSTENNYSFTDKSGYDNYRFVYYELAVTDRDGSTTYSPIQAYKTGFAMQKLVVQLGPNPLVRPEQLMIQFYAEKTGKMQMDAIDAAGRKMLSTYMTAVAGLNNGHVHICDLGPGVYTLRFAMDGISETYRVLVR